MIIQFSSLVVGATLASNVSCCLVEQSGLEEQHLSGLSSVSPGIPNIPVKHGAIFRRRDSLRGDCFFAKRWFQIALSSFFCTLTFLKRNVSRFVCSV